MKILVLGGDGMLGHAALQFLGERHDVACTLRGEREQYDEFPMFNGISCFNSVDVSVIGDVQAAVDSFEPDAVVNCVGIVKQRPTAIEAIPSLEINALLPHRLALICQGRGARLVHVSTDCVFNGRKGKAYTEQDPSDAEDLYGKSKYLGEVHDSNVITLRTSIIGFELSRNKSLLEWFLEQSGTVKGFERALYTGFTTIELSRIIERLLCDFPDASGMYQVSSDAIDKYQLLKLFREHLGHPVNIELDSEFFCDRRLDSSKFRKEFNYQPPSWTKMVKELAEWRAAGRV